jgi:hypothetical protein
MRKRLLALEKTVASLKGQLAGDKDKDDAD